MGLRKHFKFQAYYQEYFKKIYNFVYFRIGQNQSLAEDLTQDVFIQAFEHFDSFDERVKFSTWIYTIAKHKVIDHHRKQHGQLVDLGEVDNTEKIATQAEHTFVHDLNIKLQIKTVREALHKLSDKYQEIITLKYINDLDTDEICTILKRDPNYVRVNLHRALQHLIAVLKKN